MNKATHGGITMLHMAVLNGHFDCIQLLLDLNENVSAVTFHYGTSMDLIGVWPIEFLKWEMIVFESVDLFISKLMKP